MSTQTLVSAERGLEELERQLSAIRSEMMAAEGHLRRRWSRLPAARRESARNLLHYLAMRRRDLRALQAELAARGLSSLGRAESHALDGVDKVLDVVRSLRGTHRYKDAPVPRTPRGRGLLEANTGTLLGPPPAGRDIRIMVTMPSEAADDGRFIRTLLESGMDCMRINTAHDDTNAWDRMLEHLEEGRVATGRPCRIAIDLAGPKLRTGPIQPGSPVIRWRPGRDAYGRVVQPARVWMTGRHDPAPPGEPASAVLPVPAAWLASLSIGDVIKLFDARGSMRSLAIAARGDGGAWAECHQTAYIVPGTTLHITRGHCRGTAEVGDLPILSQTIRLMPGDRLILAPSLEPGRPATRNKHGDIIEPASIGLTLPAVFDDVRAGESIWLDDGAIGGVIRAVGPEGIEVAITRTRPGGARLGADKGVNLPDSTLRLPALTQKDREDLRFIDGRADLVGYSFVRTEEDVRELQSHLATVAGRQLGIVLKIETRKAFEELPSLLLAAMSSPSAGVMIARGDLAVECGYERLAEVQEEILWMAEASHTPVIWATQVLENLTKTGVPSRAEITDAAMSERAECVMLNKGAYVADAVRVLDDILTRMQGHQHKKSSMLRDLHIAERFLAA
jgi:pyruvate kinase